MRPRPVKRKYAPGRHKSRCGRARPGFAGRMKTFPRATAALRRALGTKVVLTSEAACDAASFDSLKLPFRPEAVVRPRAAADIRRCLGLANRAGVPVTTRGRGTSLTGSAAPRRGGWVLDLLGWNQVRIDATAGLADVGAGANVADLQRAAEQAGWFYPPDPSSREYCTIGGNIACNAGGMHGGRYGVTRDFVLALEGHLPTGEFVRWGTRTKKFSAGFNLRDLWIGSEGMLGVITGATLKLLPQPAERWTLLTAFADETAAFRAVQALFGRRVQPAICEFLDRDSVVCAERATGRTVFRGQPGRPVVLLDWREAAPNCASSAGRSSPGRGSMPPPSAPPATGRRPRPSGRCGGSARARCSSWAMRS